MQAIARLSSKQTEEEQASTSKIFKTFSCNRGQQTKIHANNMHNTIMVFHKAEVFTYTVYRTSTVYYSPVTVLKTYHSTCTFSFCEQGHFRFQNFPFLLATLIGSIHIYSKLTQNRSLYLFVIFYVYPMSL